MQRFKAFTESTRSHKECPECQGIMDKTHNDKGEAVHKCRCCDKEFSRKTYDTKKKQARRAKSDELDALMQDLMK